MKNIIFKQSALILLLLLSASQLQAVLPLSDAFLKKINTDGDETSCAISGDGKLFIFARKPKEKESSDLYFSEFKNGEWSEAETAADLNSDSDDISPYISSDGKFILFSSNRNGSLKSRSEDKPSFDIYYSQKTDNGWQKPELLFGAVNTTYDELNPFIPKEGNILYFTRSRDDGSFNRKIIKAFNRNDSWEDIRTAEISGNPVFDIYLLKKSIYKSGSYIIGDKKDEQVKHKIFYIEDAENKTGELKNITGAENAIAEGISISELSEDSIIISSNSSGIAGSYDLFIKGINPKTKSGSLKSFSLKIDSGNYDNPDKIKIKVLFFSSLKKNTWPESTEFKTPDLSGMINISVKPEIERILLLPGVSGIKSFAVEYLSKNESITASTIKIEPAEKNEFSVKPVYFKFNSSEIQISDIPYIHQLINHLRENSNTMLFLEGYSDGIGSYKANLDISVKRAERVKEYLIKAGIKKNRITTKGSGYVKDRTDDTSQQNRRVESNIFSQ